MEQNQALDKRVNWLIKLCSNMYVFLLNLTFSNRVGHTCFCLKVDERASKALTVGPFANRRLVFCGQFWLCHFGSRGRSVVWTH